MTYIENKIFSAVCVILMVIMGVAIIFMNYVITNNNKAISFFNIEEFKNISYVNDDDCSFEIRDKKVYLLIDGEIIANGDQYNFDDQTGEIKIKGKNEEIYIRSVGRTNISIWYKYKVYKLDKETIAN